MKTAVLLLSLWAIVATKAGPVNKRAVQPPAPPASPAPAAPATKSASPAAPATPATAAAAKPAPVPPAELVSTKYKVSFKLANVQYAEGLSSYESSLYDNYAEKIKNALINLYADYDGYREMKMIGFRNESGVIADVGLRFANDSKNLVTLDALVKTGSLGDLPVDPASLTAVKDDSVPSVAMPMGFGCGQPCGAPQQCFPSCTQTCCGGASSYGMPQTMSQGFGAPMSSMQAGLAMPMPFPPPPMAGGQCPGQCPSSCAPACQQSCCGGAASGQIMNQPPMMG